MLDLYSAPLMDRRLIIASAAKLELHSRRRLKLRRKRLCSIHAGAPPAQRTALVAYWRSSAQTQLRAWRLSAANLDAALDLHLAKARESGTLLSNPERPLFLVRNLRLERQLLVVRWWERFFRDLQRPGPQSPCARAPAGKNSRPPVGTPTDSGPPERLFEPLALARYDFLRQLPGEFRLRLILTFHSPRNSDK